MENQAVSKVEFGAKLVAILAGIIALVVFVIDIVEDQQARRADRIDLWRQAAIQKILQEENNALHIKEMLNRIKSLAWEEIYISKDDITEDKIRVLLIKMISMGIIHQNYGDIYELNIISSIEVDNVMSKVVGKWLNIDNNFKKLLVELENNPNSYNKESLYEMVAEPIGVHEFYYDMTMGNLVTMGIIVINKDGRMTLQN